MNVSCVAMGSTLGALGDPSESTSFLHRGRETRHRHCIVLLDDHFVVRAALKAALTILDCRVVDAGSGREALDILRGGLRPCLIFLDPGMPHGGAWLFREFQLADPQLATIPVAILSARDRCPATAGELRVSHWLVKPPDVEEMVRLAASHCGADTGHRQERRPLPPDITSPAS